MRSTAHLAAVAVLTIVVAATGAPSRGALKWEREAHKGLPIGGRHRKNTYAPETPFTDGARMYVSFGLNVGLFAYSLNGDLLWTRTWPPQPISGQ